MTDTLKQTQEDSCEELLQRNRNWAENQLNTDAEYFTKLASGQQPKVLWIGCSDSRAPESTITNSRPGDIFVHRNIANLCLHADLSVLSVLDYAVNVLKVQHVVVAGHYGCGGVAASMTSKQYGLIDNWLSNIKDVYRLNKAELDGIEETSKRQDRLVELNVAAQVENVCSTGIVQNAWKAGQNLEVHGWVFDLRSGLLKDLGIRLSNNETLEPVFALE